MRYTTYGCSPNVMPVQYAAAIVRGMSVESLTPSEKNAVGPLAPVWRFRSIGAVAALALAGLSIWLFWDGLYQMWGFWIDEPEPRILRPLSMRVVW